MKNKPFPLFVISLLLLLAVNGFSQNNSTVFEDTSKLVVFNRPRLSTDNFLETKKTVTVLELEKRVFGLVNEQRRASGLSELDWSDGIAKIARVHSQNMANYKFFSHQGLDGSTVSDRADSLKISRWQSIGENIAYNRGYANPIKLAVESWMESTGHRNNILNRGWKETGIGVAIASNGSYYFTQVFLSK